jgi:FAD/FMN-containing dehydrogenase
MGKYALALDNLLSVELVLADGSILTAGPDTNADGTVNLIGHRRIDTRNSGWTHGSLCQSGNPSDLGVRKAWVRAARY